MNVYYDKFVTVIMSRIIMLCIISPQTHKKYTQKPFQNILNS